MSTEVKDKGSMLLDLVKSAIENDKNLREQYQVKEKFRFIRDRLIALFSHLQENLKEVQEKESKRKVGELSADETLVYVYLFNAQGSIFKTWEKMLNPSVFYEYSINRPIYGDKKYIEAIIRTKKNKSQHGYLTIIIKKEDLLQTVEEVKDGMGHPLLRVREGSLKPDQLLTFTHVGRDYILDDQQELVRKNENG